MRFLFGSALKMIVNIGESKAGLAMGQITCLESRDLSTKYAVIWGGFTSFTTGVLAHVLIKS